MGKLNYTIEELKIAVANSVSIASCLTKLGLAAKGGNYRTFKKLVEKYQIDTSHFKGQGHMKGKTHSYALKPLEDVLQDNVHYSSHKLKLRLIKAGLKQYQCEKCLITNWMGQPAPLELDHKNGNHFDNRLENLRILCPNCHAQTEHYRGKAKKQKKYKTKSKTLHKKDLIKEPKETHYCIECNKQLKTKAKTKMCSKCIAYRNRKVKRPSLEQLNKDLSKMSFCAVGRKYGVSDNAVRKWIKFYKST